MSSVPASAKLIARQRSRHSWWIELGQVDELEDGLAVLGFNKDDRMMCWLYEYHLMICVDEANEFIWICDLPLLDLRNTRNMWVVCLLSVYYTNLSALLNVHQAKLRWDSNHCRQPCELANVGQAATSAIQETQQSIAGDEADLKAKLRGFSTRQLKLTQK